MIKTILLIGMMLVSSHAADVVKNNGIYKIKVQASGLFWHENGNGDKYVTTLHQVDDDFTLFRFVDNKDGSWSIHVVANNRRLHQNDSEPEQRISTLFQPLDDHTRFIMEIQSPSGDYRIKVKANGKYLHANDGPTGDKFVSTRFQPNDGYTKFTLVKQYSC